MVDITEYLKKLKSFWRRPIGLPLPWQSNLLNVNTPLELPDIHHAHAAVGWIELGDYAKANEELDKIAPHYGRILTCWKSAGLFTPRN